MVREDIFSRLLHSSNSLAMTWLSDKILKRVQDDEEEAMADNAVRCYMLCATCFVNM